MSCFCDTILIHRLVWSQPRECWYANKWRNHYIAQPFKPYSFKWNENKAMKHAYSSMRDPFSEMRSYEVSAAHELDQFFEIPFQNWIANMSHVIRRTYIDRATRKQQWAVYTVTSRTWCPAKKNKAELQKLASKIIKRYYDLTRKEPSAYKIGQVVYVDTKQSKTGNAAKLNANKAPQIILGML